MQIPLAPCISLYLPVFPVAPCISLYPPVSPSSSLYLPLSTVTPCISLYLPVSPVAPCISLYPDISPSSSLYLPVSPVAPCILQIIIFILSCEALKYSLVGWSSSDSIFSNTIIIFHFLQPPPLSPTLLRNSLLSTLYIAR